MISRNQIKFVKQLEMKKHRQREGCFVAEGPKVVGDLLAAGLHPVQLFAIEEWAASCHASLPHPVIVTPDELRHLSFLQHPQQVLAVFPIPNNIPHCHSRGSNSQPITNRAETSEDEGTQLVLALDGIQDPGNLGTIIRIADWFGIDDIVCSLDTADAWSPKVVQATMGSIARVNISYTDLKQFLEKTEAPIYGTLLDGDDIYLQDLPRKAVIVMGNEGNGISQDIRQMVTHRLLIPPFRQGAESLNVAIATAITCSEFRRRFNYSASIVP